ncbi:MAG: hypothetical protein PWR07_1295 [Bacillota bacterium]|nr:hypothetical protein [Bacillota bacterium]
MASAAACWYRTCFNPRLRAGGDQVPAEFVWFDYMFQPTPPRGRRPSVTIDYEEYVPFQPTPPRGRRRAAASSVCFM